MNRYTECKALSPDPSDAIVICIVDDDSSVRKSLSNLLRSAGFDTWHSRQGRTSLPRHLL